MSARRSIAQRQMPPPQQSRQQQQFNNQQNDSSTDIKKMHPMAVLTMHEDRLNDIEDRLSQLQSTVSSSQTNKRSTGSGDETSMLAECIKQIKFLIQENQTNRNLARELTLEVLRLKTSLQEDGKIKIHVSEETQDKFEMFKETANAKQQQQKHTQSQNVRDELLATDDNGASTMSFSGNGYDPNSL
jgi:hypothetical protein